MPLVNRIKKRVPESSETVDAQSTDFGLTRPVCTLPASNSNQLSSLNLGCTRAYFTTYWIVDKLQALSHYLHHLLITLLTFPSDCFLAFSSFLFLQQPLKNRKAHITCYTKWFSTKWRNMEEAWFVSYEGCSESECPTFFFSHQNKDSNVKIER